MRWTGWLKAPRPGRYTLRLEAQTAGRLWLDGQLSIDSGASRGPFKQDVEVELDGRPHALRVEYVHFTGARGSV